MSGSGQSSYSLHPFIPNTGILGFPYDIIIHYITSLQGSSTLNELSNQQLSHLETPTCMHMSRKISRKFLILHPFLKRQHLTHFGCSIPWNTLCISLFHLGTLSKCDYILRTMHFVCLHVYTLDNQIINISDDNLVIQRCVSGARGKGSL